MLRSESAGQQVPQRLAEVSPAASKNTVGVVTTPPRTPSLKSRCTRSTTTSPRRSASNRSRSSPNASARAHRCGSSSRPWSARTAVVHLPEAPLRCSGLSRAGGLPTRAGAMSAPESGGTPGGADRRQPAEQAHMHHGAVRALEVRVLDQERRAVRAAHVVVLGQPGYRRGTEVAHRPAPDRCARRLRPLACRPSKIRFAPGRSPGESA